MKHLLLRAATLLLLAAPLAAEHAGAQSLLPGPRPHPTCETVGEQFPLPTLATIADTAGLAGELGGVLKPGGWVAMTVGWDSTGAPDTTRVALSEGLSGADADAAARVLSARLRRQPTHPYTVRLADGTTRSGRRGYHLLVRADAGAPPRLRVAWPEFCRPDLLNRDWTSREVGRQAAGLGEDARRLLPQTAQVRMRVSAEGRVTHAELDRSTNHGEMDRAALLIARRMVFRPAYINRRPVATWVTIPITFNRYF